MLVGFITISIIVLVLASQDHSVISSAPGRKLVVDGQDARIEDWPFVVMLVACDPSCMGENFSPIICTCTQVCSGSLVSGRIVVTAAHCLWDGDDRSKKYDYIDSGFVVAGVSRLEEATQSNYYAIGSISNPGWSNNFVDYENDIAVIYLRTCVDDLTPVRIATSRELDPDSACTEVAALGFGRRHTYVQEFFGAEEDKGLQVTYEFLHSYDVCVRSVSFTLESAQDGTGELFHSSENETIEYLSRYSNDRMICFGGASTSGVCQGDSGGPVVTWHNGEWLLIGVNSFGWQSCAVYADFAVRVAYYAEWLREILQAVPANRSCGHNYQDVFASWPPPVWARSEIDQANCFVHGEKWTCKVSGECIDWRKRCDGTIDCADNSDEVIECPLNFWFKRCPLVIRSWTEIISPTSSQYYDMVYAIDRITQNFLTNPEYPPAQSLQSRVASYCTVWMNAIETQNLLRAARDEYHSMVMDHDKYQVFLEPCLKASNETILSYVSLEESLETVRLCYAQLVQDTIYVKREQYVKFFARELQQCGKQTSVAPTPQPSSRSTAKRKSRRPRPRSRKRKKRNTRKSARRKPRRKS